MRSPQPLLVPLLVLSLLAVAGLLLHNAIQPWAGLIAVRRTRLAAIVILALGVLGLFLYPVLGGLPYYAIVVPLTIGLAAAVLAYLSYLTTKLRDLKPQVVLIGLLAVITLTCAFWATATTAQYSGRGLGEVRREAAGPIPSGHSRHKGAGAGCAPPAWRRQCSSLVRGKHSTTATAACAC